MEPWKFDPQLTCERNTFVSIIPVTSMWAKESKQSLLSLHKLFITLYDLCAVYHFSSPLTSAHYVTLPKISLNSTHLRAHLFSYIHNPFKQSSKDNEISCRSDWKQPSSCEPSNLSDLCHSTFKMDRLKLHSNLVKMDWRPGELLSVRQWEKECFWFLRRRILHLPSSSFNTRVAAFICCSEHGF